MSKVITITLRRRRGPASPQNSARSDKRAAGVAWVSAWDRKVLMLLRGPDGDHPGTWCFPAGSIDPGETPQAAAVRELYEETRCWNAPNNKLTTPVWDKDGFVLFLYLGSKFGPIINAESDDFVWALLDAPPEPLHPGVEEQLEAVRQALEPFERYYQQGR